MTALRLAAALAACLAVSSPQSALANGRLPDGTGVRSHGANDILFPSTFGLLTSDDGGATFQWICEGNVGYSGTYDPDYAVAVDGDIWATTFEGLRVSRDSGCTWVSMEGLMADRFFSDVEIGSDGSVWAASATGGQENDVFVSRDGGTTFVSANLTDPLIWWRSVRIAAQNPMIVFATGFLLAQPDGNGGTLPSEAHLRKSIDGGATWTALPVTDFAFGQSPNLFIESIATDPNIVFARVLGAKDPIGDDIYRTADGGLTWTRVLEFQDFVDAFLIHSDGATVVAGTRGNCIGDDEAAMKGCVMRSTDLGLTWQLATTQPKMGCIQERAGGELVACGANWEPDNFALGRSSDKGQTWSKIVRFSELSGPLSCPMSSPQFECAALDWPFLCVQLGICDAAGDAGPDGGSDGGGGGICGCSASGAGFALIFVLPLAWRSRRRRRAVPRDV